MQADEEYRICLFYNTVVIVLFSFLHINYSVLLKLSVIGSHKKNSDISSLLKNVCFITTPTNYLPSAIMLSTIAGKVKNFHPTALAYLKHTSRYPVPYLCTCGTPTTRSYDMPVAMDQAHSLHLISVLWKLLQLELHAHRDWTLDLGHKVQ